jgi:hypothetical protein
MAKSQVVKSGRDGKILWIACVLAVLCLSGLARARAADSDSVNDGAKKVGNNFGELLKGMGQELKKAGGKLGGRAKKDKEKEKKQADKEPDAARESR